MDLPALRVAPPDVARLIDEQETGARLLYAGEGRWRLWRLARGGKEQASLRRSGIQQLDSMLSLDPLRVGGASGRNTGAVVTALMNLRGYAWEWDYELRGEPGTWIADNFGARLWFERRDTSYDLEQRINRAAGEDRLEARIRAAQEYNRLEGPSRHRHAFRKPVSIVNPWSN